jgi:hypothetical protein
MIYINFFIWNTDAIHVRSVSENKSVSISCTSGTLQIIYATYGYSTDIKVSYCDVIDVKSILESRCNNLSSCSVTSSNDALGGDPCPGKAKTLFFQFSCN